MTTLSEHCRRWTVGLAAVGCLSGALPGYAQEERYEVNVPFRAITGGESSHWFAYYDKLQFDTSGRYVLGMRVDFDRRSPRPDDEIELGMVDLEANDRWIPFAKSRAWCWQQGCMLQWLPGSSNEVIYNDRVSDRYVSIVRNVHTGETRVLPKPVYSVSPTGTMAVGLNFARVGQTRPGYGYNGLADPGADRAHPADDGVYVLNLSDGTWRTVVSVDEVAHIRPNPTMRHKGWFNHCLWNTDGTRFIFLHRWYRNPDNKGPRFTRMFTVAPDGRNLYCVADHDMVSHFIWPEADKILAWSTEPKSGNRFHIYEDRTENVEVVGEGVLKTDGHCTVSPDGDWILTDTYPDRERMQALMLYRPKDGKLVALGKFFLPPDMKGEIRCDLHPRWSRDGKSICIDSAHSGRRQMLLLDVSEIIR